jgi:hypothetical protein
VFLFKRRSLIFNGQEISQRIINTMTGRTAADHRTQNNAASGRFQRGIFALKQ